MLNQIDLNAGRPSTRIAEMDKRMNHLSIGHGDVLAHAHNPVLTAVAQMFRRRFAIAKNVGPNGHSVSTVDHHTGSDRLPPKQRGETAGKRIVVD